MNIRDRRGVLGPALAAGAIAITVNTFALKAADWASLATAKGGLLRLITPWFSPLLKATGMASIWRRAGAPAPNSPSFQMGFHVMVGLAMAVVYAYLLEPILPGKSWLKGATYALAAWTLNAAVVLPVTGEGFAGAAHLTLAGMAWFACAHTLFFMLLAMLYGAFPLRPAASALRQDHQAWRRDDRAGVERSAGSSASYAPIPLKKSVFEEGGRRR